MVLSVLEWSAVILGLIQGILIMIHNKENWIFYNAMIIVLIVYSLIVKLYGDVFENSIYLFMGIYGLILWNKKSEKPLKVSVLTNKERVFYSGVILLATTVITYLLRITDDPLPLLDAFTTALGIAATWLMAKKKLETWVLWFIDDILMAVVYFTLPNQAFYLMLLNIVWTALAVGSYTTWYKELHGGDVNEEILLRRQVQ